MIHQHASVELFLKAIEMEKPDDAKRKRPEADLEIEPESFERLVGMPTRKLELKTLGDEKLELEDFGREQVLEARDERVDWNQVILRLEGEEETGRPESQTDSQKVSTYFDQLTEQRCTSTMLRTRPNDPYREE